MADRRRRSDTWTGDQPAAGTEIIDHQLGAPRPRMTTQAANFNSGFAVRRQWPDGAHDFVNFSMTPDDAARVIVGDQKYWKRGPVTPTSWAVVPISVNDFDIHRSRRLCRAPDCPDSIGGSQ